MTNATRVRGLAAAALLLFSSLALAQGYPSKPIRILSQFGAGLPGEFVARVVAAQMTVTMGQPVLIESRTGGGGVLAASLTARSAPDGYTIGALNLTVPVIGAVLLKDLPFDPVKDLVPIIVMASIPAVIAANPGFPPNSLAELIDYAKEHPGKVTFGTTGVGSSFHLTMEEVAALTGAKMQHIPYKTSPVLDAVTGAINFAFVVIPQAMPLINSGKVKPLGVTATRSRTRLLPDVPTVREIVPGFEPVPDGTVLFGPAGMPGPVLHRLSAEAAAALNQAEVRDRLTGVGCDIPPSQPPEELAAEIKRQIALVARIAQTAGLKRL